jgi:hypothetical protein
MAGEVFVGDDDYVVPRAAIMMESAIAWILFYHIVLKPFNLMPPDPYMTQRYEEAGLHCRFSYFKAKINFFLSFVKIIQYTVYLLKIKLFRIGGSMSTPTRSAGWARTSAGCKSFPLPG